MPGEGVGTPYRGLYGEAVPGRGTFFRLQVWERVGISQDEVYKSVGKSVIWACKRAKKGLADENHGFKKSRNCLFLWLILIDSYLACSAGVFFKWANVLLAKAPFWNLKREEKMGRVKRSGIGGRGERREKREYFFLPSPSPSPSPLFLLSS